MPRKMKEDCSATLEAMLKKAGGTFPEEDFSSNSSSSSSSSSGTDTSEVKVKRRHKKHIKSGAKVKKRPVVQTELWPHTIANEEDGEEVTSEDINLAKFLSCFTQIMNDCESSTEATGRSTLLHAVTTVLGCQPWAEARTFHNLVMTKIEQGKINWKANFSILAKQFIEKKVWNNLRASSARGTASGSGTYSKASSGYRRAPEFGGRGYGNYPSQGQVSGNQAGSMICRQFNRGSCSYGERCKRWHVCLSCAEAGKIGERHTASSHYNSSTRGRQYGNRP